MSNGTKIILGGVSSIIVVIILAFVFGGSKSYTVTFDSDGGTVIESQTVKKGEKVTEPDSPLKEGYTFKEWQLDGSLYDFNSKVNSNITLVAYWEKNVNKYIVSLQVDDLKKEASIEEGKTVDESTLSYFNKEGYGIEWSLDKEVIDINTFIVKEDVNLVGKYVKLKTFEVKFDSDGGSKVDSQKIYENKQVVKPDDPTKNGFVFNGWYLGNTEYDFTSAVTKNITLKAKWIEDSNVKRYVVTFNSDGGSSVAKQTIIDGEKAKKPANPTKSGYSFKEWQLDGKAFDFNNKITKDITLKAAWVNAKFTVTFNSNKGSSVSSQIVDSGETVVRPNNPERANYSFKGWYLDGVLYKFDSAVTKDITLVAEWEALPKYTVAFDSDGGTSVPSQTVVKGGKAFEPVIPQRDLYKFIEWQLDGIRFNFNTPINTNITLKAKWEKLTTYTVTFDSNGGSSVSSQIIVKGERASKPNDPTKGDCLFARWLLNGIDFNFNSAINGNITLVAEWNC